MAKRDFLALDLCDDPVPLEKLGAQVAQADPVAAADPAAVGRLGECERHDAEADKILPVNAREALGDHQPEPHDRGNQRRVLTTRPLAIVSAGDDGVPLLGRGRLARISRVEPFKGELPVA